MATTDNAPAIEAATEPQPATRTPIGSTAVSTPMALSLLGDDLRAIERRLARWIETEPSESRRIRLRYLQEVVQRAMEHYGQINDSLVRKALAGD